MKYNLFISYDLFAGQAAPDYQSLADAISKLGSAYNIQKSLWFVRSEHGVKEVLNRLEKSITHKDYLIVIEARHAAWTSLTEDSEDILRDYFDQTRT